MRLMLAAILVTALAWSGYWWIAARHEAEDIRGWLDARAAATHSGVEVHGFPYRFDTTVTRPWLRLGAVSWTAPFVKALRLSYRADHYILALADRQEIDLPDQRIAVGTADSRASVVIDGDAAGRSRLVLEEIDLASSAGWTGAARRILFATRDAGGAQEIGLDVEGLDLGPIAAARLHAEGSLRIGPQGIPDGSLEIVSNAWPGLLAFAAAQGWITPEQEKTIAAAADGPALMLTLREGAAFLGPVALGRVPPLDLR